MAHVGRGSDQFNLRMPDGLRERIREKADENRRSMNSEIVKILENAIFDPLEMKKGDVTA